MSLVTFSQMEKDNEGIKAVYPKVQSSGFMTAELLITKKILGFHSLFPGGPRGKAETKHLE